MMTRALMMLPLAATIGCGSDLVLPSAPGGAAPEGLQLSIVDGNGQIGTVGEELPEPLVVSVASGESPARGHRVAFLVSDPAAAGRLEPDTAVTDDDGYAVATWVLGTEPGHYQVVARLVASEPAPLQTAVFEASAVAGDPDTARAVSPTGQPGRKGQPAPDDPAIIVVDRFGNPVGGVDVVWEVTAGGGSVNSPVTSTGSDGRASVTWLLGSGIGVQKLNASVEGVHGSPVRFSAVVLF
jgi:hypothetical protein